MSMCGEAKKLINPIKMDEKLTNVGSKLYNYGHILLRARDNEDKSLVRTILTFAKG